MGLSASQKFLVGLNGELKRLGGNLYFSTNLNPLLTNTIH